MDAVAAEVAGAERRLSVTRLMAALRPHLVDEALLLPLCFLFARHLRFDSADPLWADRDRLSLDSGQAALGGVLAGLAGLPGDSFRAPGPAFAIGVGLALAERLLAARFGRSLVDHRSWVVASAGSLATGAAQEAACLAGAWQLNRLTAIAAVPSADTPGLGGFAAAGWSVRRINGGVAAEVAAAISAALRAQRPTLIACVQDRGEPLEAFSREAVEESAHIWHICGKRSAGVRRAWLKRLARHGSRVDFEATLAGKLPHAWYTAFYDPGPLLPPGQAVVSTAWTLRRALARLAGAVPELARLPADGHVRQPGGAAETAMSPADPLATLDQGVACAGAGLALHGGIVPASRHDLDAADLVAGGLRAAAVAGLRQLVLLTEPDSPGPSGGRRAVLRAIGNVCVFRPADASEALECGELALRRTTGPTVLLMSDVAVRLLAERPSRTRCAKGGYVLAEAAAPRAATLIASGPELHIALCALGLLKQAGIPAAIVSLPCWLVFARQEAAWHEAVLGDAPRIGIEAGSGFGWDRWLGPEGLFIGTEQMAGVCWDAARPEPAARRVADLILRHIGHVRSVSV